MHRTPTNTLVGQRIAASRTEQRLSQAELASRLSAELGRNVDPSAVTRMEGGKRPISVEEVVALSKILEVRPAELLPEGTPLLAELARWRSVLSNAEAEVSSVTAMLESARARRANAVHVIERFELLVDFSRTGAVTEAVIDAVRRAGWVVQVPDDLLAVLLDAGVDEGILNAVKSAGDGSFTTDARPGAFAAFISTQVADKLARGDSAP